MEKRYVEEYIQQKDSIGLDGDTIEKMSTTP
jgi:hypothetical protein